MRDVLPFLLGWGVRSAIVVFLAFAWILLFRRASAGCKNFIWRVALTCIPLIAIGMWSARRAPFSIPDIAPWVGQNFPADHEHLHEAHPNSPATPPYSNALDPTFLTFSPSEEDSSPFRYVVYAYLCGLAYVGLRWTIACAQVRKICRKFPVQAGVATATDPQITVPFTFGWKRPLIVLPDHPFGLDPRRREAILLHERAHIARRDWAWQTFANLVVLSQWFNPAIWILASELRATAEEAADNAVLAAGFPASEYARDLLDFAVHGRPARDAAVLGFSRKRRLKQRIANLVDRSQERVPVRPGQVALTLATLSPAMLGIAAYGQSFARDTDPGDPPYRRVDGVRRNFSDGTKVEILFVSGQEASLHDTWDAKGSPSKYRPTREERQVGGTMEKRHRMVSFGFSVRNPRRLPTTLNWPSMEVHLNGTIWNGGTAHADYERRNGKVYRSFRVPIDWKTADLRVAIGHGKFATTGEWTPSSSNLNLTVDSYIDSHRRQKPSVGSDGVTRNAFIHLALPANARDKDWQILAFDKQGKEVRTWPLPSGPSPAQMERMMALAPTSGLKEVVDRADYRPLLFGVQGPPDEIARIQFQTRDYEWIQIPDVALYPRPKK